MDTERVTDPDRYHISEQHGLLRVVVTRRRKSERLSEVIDLLRALADALENHDEMNDYHGTLIPRWLIDHVTVDSFSGYATAYLRPNGFKSEIPLSEIAFMPILDEPKG